MGLCDSKLPADSKVKKKEKKISEKLDEQLGTTSIGKKRSSTHNPNQQTNFIPLQFPYEIYEEPLDPSNDKIKLIRQTNSDNIFVLKYIFGNGSHLNKIISRVQDYSKLKFAYLVPILQNQSEQNQVIFRLNYYEYSLKTLAIQNYFKCDLLMIFYRIAKAIQQLEKHGIRHNKIQPSNIFLTGKDLRVVQVGLPSWTDPKQKETVSTRVLHISSLHKLFTIFFPVQTKNEESLKALMLDMKNCSNNKLSISQIVQSIFTLNHFDQILAIDDLKKVRITDENGDIYEGEVDKNQNKEGYGVMTEAQSKYWGYWASNLRSRRGNFESKLYIYIGNWNHNKRDGFGLEIMRQNHEYYEGNYKDEQRNGFGVWEEPNGEIYIGQWKDNKKEGYGTYYDGKGLYYEGTWQNDEKHGSGQQVHSNGNIYKGGFKHNQKDGKGHLIHPGKFQYNGVFKDNSITGFGTFKDRDGNEYVGDLVGGEYEGRGKFINKDKTYFYEGQWKNGARYGQGQERSKDSIYIGSFVSNIRDGKGTLKELKETYIGQFKKGKITGKGEYCYENGDTYKGYFVDKLKQGKGVYISAVDGSTYEGNWKKDKKHGKGKHMQKTGGYYEGQWIESKRDGFGVQYKNDLNKYQGYWKNDKKQGKGIQLQDGNRYEGEFKEGLKYSSLASLIFVNADRYQGGFVENRIQGKGKYTCANGDEYMGSFLANKRQEQGKIIYKATGITYEGSWKDDKKQGHGVEAQQDGQYVGEFVNNKKHGKGIKTYIGQEGTCKLSGVWVNGLKHGEFEFFFSDGSYEKREYSNDRQMNLGMTALLY